jgi:hypothetical protein
VGVFIYKESEGIFEYQDLRGVQYQNAHILNLIANDFNDDGNIDLLVTYNKTDTNKTYSEIFIFGRVTGMFKSAYKFDNAAEGIFIADLGETRGIDIVYYDSQKNMRQILYLNGTDPFVYIYYFNPTF